MIQTPEMNIFNELNQYIHLCTVHPLEVHHMMNIEEVEKTSGDGGRKRKRTY